MNIKFKRLRLKNFLSTGNFFQDIPLDGSILTLILGLISESETGVRNGAGKSTILQAISYGLYGKPLTKISIPNLVNNTNRKACVVVLEFEAGDKTYRIERGQKPAVLKLFVDNDEMKQEKTESEALGENRSTQVEINRVIGMSHMMFKHIVGLNTFTIPFLRESAAAQREIIEELLGITQISARAEKLKTIMMLTKDTMREQQAHITATTDANARIERTLQSLQMTERKWLQGHEEKIERLSADIASLGQIDFEAALAAFVDREAYDALLETYAASRAPLEAEMAMSQRAIAALDREIANGRKRIRETGGGGAQKRAENEIARRHREVDRHREQIERLTVQLTQLKIDLERDGDTCACCGQSLDGIDHLATVQASLRAQIASCEASIVRETTSSGYRLQEIAEIEKEAADEQAAMLTQAAALDEKLTELEAERLALENDLGRTKAEIAKVGLEAGRIGARPEVMFETREDLYETRGARDMLERDLANEKAKTNPYADQIVTIRGTLQKIDYTLINELTEDAKHQDFLLKLLTSKDSFVRKKIVDQNLPYLNHRMSFYLDALALPHEVVFQSDLTVAISHLGNSYDFEQLSRGEMNRVIMATAFAFRDVWENLNHAINLLWVDELLDQGTCTPGVEAAFGILQNMGMKRGKNVFLISHKEELKSRVNDTLLCRKSQDFTSFEWNAVV